MSFKMVLKKKEYSKNCGFVSLYRQWEKKRDSIFLNMLEENPNARVIDLGCGNGDFTLRVKEKMRCPTIYEVHIWKQGLNLSKKDIEIIIMDLNQKLSLKSNGFDIVISHQVIEHLLYPSQFIKEIHRILKPKGIAVISTNNLCSWDNIFSLLLGYTPFSMQFDNIKIGNPFSPHDKKEFKNSSHLRVFSYKALIDIFESADLKIAKLRGSGYLPLNLFSNIDPRHARFIIIKAVKHLPSFSKLQFFKSTV